MKNLKSLEVEVFSDDPFEPKSHWTPNWCLGQVLRLIVLSLQVLSVLNVLKNA